MLCGWFLRVLAARFAKASTSRRLSHDLQEVGSVHFCVRGSSWRALRGCGSWRVQAEVFEAEEGGLRLEFAVLEAESGVFERPYYSRVSGLLSILREGVGAYAYVEKGGYLN